MKKNMGIVDKVIRILAAVLIAALYITNTINGTWAIILLAAATIFIATSFVGVCPVYSALGFRTNKKTSEKVH